MRCCSLLSKAPVGMASTAVDAYVNDVMPLEDYALLTLSSWSHLSALFMNPSPRERMSLETWDERARGTNEDRFVVCRPCHYPYDAVR